MFNIVFFSIFCIFAIYGIINFIKNIKQICTYNKFENEGIHFIIAAKNQENIIEEFLRTSLFRIIYGREEIIKNITLVDLNSTDKTKNIMENISSEYDNLEVLKLNELKNIIENIS